MGGFRGFERRWREGVGDQQTPKTAKHVLQQCVPLQGGIGKGVQKRGLLHVSERAKRVFFEEPILSSTPLRCTLELWKKIYNFFENRCRPFLCFGRRSFRRPHDIWVTQGVGEGLPIMVPLAKDPRADRFLMDQLVDTGSRTVEGMAAMNGEMIRRMKVPNPGKGDLSPFETAYQNLKEVMDGLRANPHVGFNHEKTMDKIQDTFSVFKDKKGARKGNPDDEIPDDGVDFSVPEDEKPPKPPETEEQGETPEYEDMIDGPLPAKGLGAGPKYLGKPRFPWAAIWAPPTTLCFGLEGKNGVAHRYSFDGGSSRR